MRELYLAYNFRLHIGVLAGFGTKLSSAGLVYKHYGKQIIAQLLGLPMESPEVGTVYTAVYKNFIHGVDAIDNGLPPFLSHFGTLNTSQSPPEYFPLAFSPSRLKLTLHLTP